MSTKLEWKKGRSDETSMAVRMTWESRCGRYQVVRSQLKYADADGTRSVTFYAMAGPRDLLERHRTRKAAERTCQRHANGAE